MDKVCIVGWGAIGEIHAKALSVTNNAEFYAVCDVDNKRTESCCKD